MMVISHYTAAKAYEPWFASYCCHSSSPYQTLNAFINLVTTNAAPYQPWKLPWRKLRSNICKCLSQKMPNFKTCYIFLVKSAKFWSRLIFLHGIPISTQRRIMHRSPKIQFIQFWKEHCICVNWHQVPEILFILCRKWIHCEVTC